MNTYVASAAVTGGGAGGNGCGSATCNGNSGYAPGGGGGSGANVAGANNIYGPAGGAGQIKLTYQVATYADSGTFTSGAINLPNVGWTTFSSSTTNYTGTAVRIRVRSSPTSDMTARYSDFSTCTDLSEGARLSSGGCVVDGDQFIQYQATLAASDTAYTPYLNSVTIGYSTYNTSGNLVSSMFDTNQTTNVIGGMQWTEDVDLPNGTGVTVSVVTTTADGTVESPTWIDLTSVTANCSKDVETGLVTCTDLAIPDIFKTGSNARYMKYKVAMTAASLSPVTPIVSNVTMVYVVNAPPEVQNVTAIQNANGTVSIAYEVRDTDTLSGQPANQGHITPSFEYWDGNSWEAVSAPALAAGDTDTKSVDSVGDPILTTDWTPHTATWTPTVDFPNQYLPATVKIRVTADDGEGANRTGYADSVEFAFDTLAPADNSVLIYATTTPAQLVITSTDVNQSEMMISTDSNFTGASWQAFNANPTYSLTDSAVSPPVVYVKLKDAFNNISAPFQASTPFSLRSVMIQDTSNVLATPPEYRLFVAWKALNAGTYKVYRRVGLDGEWTLRTTIADPTTNFYTDVGLDTESTYYYRVTNVVDGNVSFFSSTVNGQPNGAQDSGEGGGGSAAPTISAVASSTTPGTATITWNTDVLANSEVGYSTPGNDFGNTVTVASMVDNADNIGQHSVTIAGLTPNTTYYFRVRSTTAGAVETTDDNSSVGYTFKTKSGPTITGTSVERVTNSTARIQWTTSAAANSYVYYSANADLSSSSVTSSDDTGTSHDITITGLSSGTQYHFYVQSTDAFAITEYDKNVVGNVIKYYSFRTTSDTTVPVISSVASSTTDVTATVTWATNELSDSQIEYGLTNSYGFSTATDTVQTIQHAQTISGLTPNTTYHFRVRSQDENGLLANGSDKTFTTAADADTTPPTIPTGPTADAGLTTAVITWTTNEESNSVVDYGTSLAYGAMSGSSTESVTDHSVTITGLTGNTTYKYRIQSSDALGNRTINDNTGLGHEFITTLDSTPPTIENVTTALVSDTSAVITWTTTEAAQAQVKYGTSNTFGTETATTTSYVTNHSVTLSGLTADTTYYYEVLANDASGNVTTANNSYTFTTTREPGRNVRTGVQPRDTGAPLLSNIQITDITDRGATISWSTDEPADSMMKYGTSTSYGYSNINIDDFLTSHSLTLKRLSPETEYHFKLFSDDAFGNRGSSDDQSFSTVSTIEALTALSATSSDALGALPEEEVGTSPEDVKKAFESAVEAGPMSLIESLLNAMVKNPLINTLSEKLFVSSFTDVANKVISAPTITGAASKVEVDGNTAKISWTTDKKSTSEVGYAEEELYGKDKLQPYGYVVTTPDEFDTKHTVLLQGLKSNTTYHYQLRSKGIAGPTAKSRDEIFKTEAELPIVTDFFTKDVTEHGATIVWKTNIPTSASVEFKEQGSDKVLSQGEGDMVRDHSIALKDLNDGTTYTVVVKATDAAGVTASSQPISFITLKDTVPPTFATMKSESTFYAGKESKVQTIISWETDEPATSQVFYKEGVGSKGTVVSVPEDPTLVKKHTVVITKFRPGAVYKFWVISKDDTGNEGRSKDFTVLTPQQKETVIDIIINNFEQVFGWTQKVRL